MTTPHVAIIDSGGANINSVVFALERLGCKPQFTSDWETIRHASHVVLPGVGSADAAMRQLQNVGLAGKIPSLNQPVLGICLGMQLLFESSSEGNVDCLGILPGTVGRLGERRDVTIPHMGWNTNRVVNRHLSPMFAELQDQQYAYFVHSFAAPLGPFTVAKCQHGDWFSSMVVERNFIGIQFHPERSADFGERLLGQFLQLPSQVQV